MKRTLLATGLVLALVATPAASAHQGRHNHQDHYHPHDHHHHRQPDASSTMAVFGDIPYGDALIAEFPADIAEINADPDVSRVVHLGDIKDGSSRCDTSYFQARLLDFQTFEDPFVYTPGDNEWTDCHRANNGGYLPTERLDTIRRMFFPHHGRTLGEHPDRVDYQSDRFPENVLWTQSKVVFGTVHIVGSDDDHAEWFTDRTDPATGQPQPETRSERAARSREYTARGAATLDWIDEIFDTAERSHAPAVAIGMQADMWAPRPPNAFDPIKAVIAERAEQFGKPVLLLEGDSHLLTVDKPADMPANLTRVVVQGSTNTPHEWLRLHVNPDSPQVFSCENVTFKSDAVAPCPAPLAP